MAAARIDLIASELGLSPAHVSEVARKLGAKTQHFLGCHLAMGISGEELRDELRRNDANNLGKRGDGMGLLGPSYRGESVIQESKAGRLYPGEGEGKPGRYHNVSDREHRKNLRKEAGK